MKLIIGLGNPGEKYKNNRHNAGYMVVDKLLKLQKNHDTLVFKTDTYMNDSGIFVKKLVDQYSINTSNLWVIHDDLDIALGSYKIQFGKGPKVHNGLTSIYENLGTKDFWHVRIGVDNRGANPTSPSATRGREYVLQDFTSEEKLILEKAISQVCKKLATT